MSYSRLIRRYMTITPQSAGGPFDRWCDSLSKRQVDEMLTLWSVRSHWNHQITKGRVLDGVVNIRDLWSHAFAACGRWLAENGGQPSWNSDLYRGKP